MEKDRKEILPEPTETEVRDWFLSTTRHSIRMELCLNALGIGTRDPQRPHDIVGEGNKFEWEVMQGFSTENRPGINHKEHVLPSLLRHRMQYHHLRWNHENSGASDEDMMLGAMDAVCSLIENRPYQGGSHSSEEIQRIIGGNPLYRRRWMTDALTQIQKIHLPDLNQILSLSLIPNLGLPKATHEAIVARVRETVALLDLEYGYKNIGSPR